MASRLTGQSLVAVAGGVIVTLAVACGGQAQPAGQGAARSSGPMAAPSVSSGAPRYALARAPIALLEPTSSGPAFQVRVRMSRRLPSDAEGVRMNVLVGTSGSDAPPQPFGNRTRHCYEASIGNDIHGGDPALRAVHRGSVVKVKIAVQGQRTLVRSVRLKTSKAFRTAVRSLGCGRP